MDEQELRRIIARLRGRLYSMCLIAMAEDEADDSDEVNGPSAAELGESTYDELNQKEKYGAGIEFQSDQDDG